MDASADATAWLNGYETAIEEAIRLIDAMRGPAASNLVSPILLRIRAELIALRESGPAPTRKAA
ncbi:MAG: hypothetical protein IPI33_00825 [Dehalococcoidia bacterium]|uniref:hypothetical protein n=1 Tax=Candidatus Amarobacter glycogenicus TaxID=3140699 RepID=UPI001DCBDA02|nr:hypothetical protein [Dehalococcoidia bacterium]HQZ87055.1 hypothetical protein [Actinomycetota bacterium]MBK6560582.1 hypothetical protein [Dehalococcoidia bacterium]MBK7124978.1 hypothetical protein [Dehalococcoidia bacterium]MBK7329032.1 hypothetical protein [Dehalococcoidia bacterium]